MPANNGFMQGRGSDPTGLDDFPTPPWATRALCWRLAARHSLSGCIVREPCANRGYMARPLGEFFGTVWASDIVDYSAGFPICDYVESQEFAVDWTISNPPYKLAVQFIEKAILNSRVGVAMLLRGSFIEGQRRYIRLFRDNPPMIYHFAERVPMFRGRVDPEASSPAVYSWYVWDKTNPQPGCGRGSYEIIEPCRKALELPGDYLPRPST